MSQSPNDQHTKTFRTALVYPLAIIGLLAVFALAFAMYIDYFRH